MQYTAVASSSIAAVGYDPASGVLAIRFHDGAEYHYFAVPKRLFDGLQVAPSVGGYYHENVRNAGFRYKRAAKST